MLVKTADDVEAITKDIVFMLEASKDGVEVTIKENKETRGTRQNAFYWVIVRDISKFMIGAGAYYELHGVRLEYHKYMVHDINKAMYSIDSTTKLTVKEFIEYMDSMTSFWSSRTNDLWKPKEAYGG